jgi:poly-gamma-glutamate capsule biosynthesis protein CapA/YwtB (metallophosphatase superfamily)
MRGKHRRRRPPPGPITRSTMLVGAVALAMAVPHQAGEPVDPTHRRARLAAPSVAAAPSPSTSLEQPVPPEPGLPRRFTIAATGDILIHESLWERAAVLGAATGEAFDFRPMFRRVRDTLAGADLALCHLETPVTADGDLSSYPVFAAPVEITDAIASAGYDSCSTASNHSLDGGTDGIEATLDALDRAGLRHAGTARSRAESRRITMLDVEGAQVAQLSYTFGFNGFTREREWQANLIEVRRILDDARRARERGSDFTVVSLHWGVEPLTMPTTFQTQVADRLTRSRFVDAIVGHHAHVVQPVERVHGKVVAYGLGNFLSGMWPSEMWPDGVEDGVIVLLRVERRGDVYRVTKVRPVPTTVEYGTWRILPAAG